MCGKCCINREDILLNPKDMYNIAKKLNTTPKEVAGEYCDAYIGEDSRMPIIRLQPRGTVRRCPFLKDRKCSIHEAKPTVCATFPIGRCLKHDVNKNGENFTPENIIYIFSNPLCGNSSERHTVREWLEGFNIPINDEFFIKWQETIINTSEALRKIENETKPDIMSMIWNIVLIVLYLDYDMDKDFMPQFEERSKRLSKCINELMSRT